jgi:hypothetical protein
MPLTVVPRLLTARPSARRWRFATAALLALAAVALLAPAEARATCGDYVVLHPSAGEHQPPVPADSPLPCSGPSCSEGSLPPLTPLAPPAPAAEKWGCASPEAARGAPPLEGAVPDPTTPRPLHRGPSVYHPPR